MTAVRFSLAGISPNAFSPPSLPGIIKYNLCEIAPSTVRLCATRFLLACSGTRYVRARWCTRLIVRSHVCMLSYTFSSPTPTFSLFPAELNHQYCRYASLGKRKRKGRKTKHLEKYTLRIPANCRSAYACAQDVPDNCVRTGTVCVRVSQLERTERPRENLDSLSVICRPSVIYFF